ncbi:MAG: hypothetical protein MUQ65_12945 [Armatimonadetes bacterium]|nr:hypothetical protein [Armatimonadota bacterium]
MRSITLLYVLCLAALLLPCLSACGAPKLPQQLEKGEAFHVVVDTAKPAHPVNRRLMGFSFHNMWDFTPLYSLPEGEWMVSESTEAAMRSLHAPFGRVLWVDPASAGGAPFGVKGGIDRAAQLCDRFGIPQEEVVLELEAQEQRQSLSPEAWAEAIKYSLSKGYKFRLWEVCNEPGNVWGAPESAAWTAEPYQAHVKAVYPAIKAVQPDALVGIDYGVNPFDQWGATQTDVPMLKDLVGYYDFVAPHFYCHLQNLDTLPLERITLGGNSWVLNSYVLGTREVLDRYNPGRHIQILDTEWAMHGYNSGSGSADSAARNGNIAGTLHRAVRLIYYLNNDLLEAAAQFLAIGPRGTPGFSIVALDDDREFLSYYLNYYLRQYVGDEVLTTSGTCPYYEQKDVPSDYRYTGVVYDVSMPEAPVLATRSADGKTVYLVAANATAEKSLPCRVELKGFRAQTAEGKRLSGDPDGAPLVDKESDVMSALPVKLAADGGSIAFDAAPHSVSFISLTAR